MTNNSANIPKAANDELAMPTLEFDNADNGLGLEIERSSQASSNAAPASDNESINLSFDVDDSELSFGDSSEVEKQSEPTGEISLTDESTLSSLDFGALLPKSKIPEINASGATISQSLREDLTSFSTARKNSPVETKNTSSESMEFHVNEFQALPASSFTAVMTKSHMSLQQETHEDKEEVKTEKPITKLLYVSTPVEVEAKVEAKEETEAEENIDIEYNFDEVLSPAPVTDFVHKPEPLISNSSSTGSFTDGRVDVEMQATIRLIREEREDLLKQLKEAKSIARDLEQDNLTLKSALDESVIEVSILRKRHAVEIEDVKYRLSMTEDKKVLAEERAKSLIGQKEKLEQKVRIDISQVRQREKELETRLEMLSIDVDSQVQSRDQKILELRRKIDSLEFNMENVSIKEQKSTDDKRKIEDKLNKIMKTLRNSIKNLEDDVESEGGTVRESPAGKSR
jgi:hypothetical protein